VTITANSRPPVWHVRVNNGPDLDVKGNILDYEYTIEDGDNRGRGVQKWFRVADTYGVEIAPGRTPRCSWPSPRSWTLGTLGPLT
jgi:uncharacterized protein YxjI